MKVLRGIRTMLILATIVFAFAAGNPARESYQRTSDILKIVQRIEEQLNKEDRLREITDIVRIDSTMDKMNKKLDRLVSLLDGGQSVPAYGRSSSSVGRIGSDGDVLGKLGYIDERLGRLEDSVERMDRVLDEAQFQKLNEMDQRSASLKDDLDKKLRKMMNIITALYEMNKDIKTNLGGRSGGMDETPQQEQGTDFAAQFLVENLEELERKIQEQFSVLTNELRSEITGLKIVASSVNDGCNTGVSDFDDDYSSTFSRSAGDKRSSQKDGPKRNPNSGGRTISDENTLDSLVQSLGRTTREIKQEIHQGIQTIEQKLSNLTDLPLRCDDSLDASASVIQPVRASREFELPPEQALDETRKRNTQACTKVAKNVDSPKSCAELRKGGANCDGAYIIFLQNVRAIRVYCDMTTDGGGWTVLVRRGDFGDQMTSFHRNWVSYKNGFGDVEGEFWLGNDALNLLTIQDDNILRVRLESFDDEDLNLTYSSFHIADEEDNYRMRLGPVIGSATPASNDLKYHSNHPFSTFDKKNDQFSQNCASTYKGGWWYNGCYFGFLTGEYFKLGQKRQNWEGILWHDWKGNTPLKGGMMMIRPKDFTIY